MNGDSWAEKPDLTKSLVIGQFVAHLQRVVRVGPHVGPEGETTRQGDERAIRHYQLEQAVKQLVLVEGHLTDARTAGSPLCCHCISKHAFALQALAEESAGILTDLAPTFQDLGRWAGEVRGEGDRCQLGDVDLTRLTERARAFRKDLMAALDREGEASAARAVPHLAALPAGAHLGGSP